MHHGVHDLEVSAALLYSSKQFLYRIHSEIAFGSISGSQFASII
jgi:hypothetical protein